MKMQLPVSPEIQKAIAEPEDLAELMANPTWEEVQALFHDRVMLGFKIDIETDSTMKQDEDAEKQSRVELIAAVGQFAQQAATIQDPSMKVLMAELLAFGVRSFRAGKNIETALELMINKLEEQAANPAPPPPSPEMMKIQAQQQQNQQEMQMKQQQAQIDNQNDQAKAQMEAQSEAREAQRQQANDQASASLAREKMMMEIQLEREKFSMQLQQDKELEHMKIQSAAAMHKYGVDNAPKPVAKKSE